MIIMGIDPGTARTGYAVLNVQYDKSGQLLPKLVEHACITTPAGVAMPHRLEILHKDLESVVDMHLPEIMVVEKLFFNSNAKTAMTVGQARGITLLVAATKKMEVFEYTALEAKKVLTGYGRADKKDMQEAVRKYMGLDEVITPDDTNDAVAMVLCYLHKDHK